MSILTEDLPKTLLGAPIRTDYRVMVTVEQLLRDPEISAQRKIIQALDLLYIKPPDAGLAAAWDGLLWYYRGGHGPEAQEQEPKTRRPGAKHRQAAPQRVYDYEIDAVSGKILKVEKDRDFDFSDVFFVHWFDSIVSFLKNLFK